MIRRCLLFRRPIRVPPRCQQRNLLTLAIETSCDDTCVALLEKHKDNSATLHSNSRITSDNREYGGVYPIAAHEGHQKTLAILIQEALKSLPAAESSENALFIEDEGGRKPRQRPDFITVTRGPGMRSNLLTGMDTAKGLAVAWQVPLLGVNHMQAHALTPRLVSALQKTSEDPKGRRNDPEFPFLTLLVSGGHSMLVHSKSLDRHEILANTTDLAVGDLLDKSAREILPPSILDSATDVGYARILESFVFPFENVSKNYFPPSSFMRPRKGSEWGYDWIINPPYSDPGPDGAIAHSKLFTFSGIGSSAKRIVKYRPDMDDAERRVLAREVMALAFEHLASRVLFALKLPTLQNVNTLVVSGGVASNKFLKTILRTILDAKGYNHVRLLFPPSYLCTDNAAMIAWTGIEMYEAGWRTSLEAMVVKKWAIDPNAEDGGILGIDGWERLAN